MATSGPTSEREMNSDCCFDV